MKLVGNVHLCAGRAEDIPTLLALLREQGIATEANPDLSVRTYHTFGIDEARELAEKAAARAFNGQRVFVMVADTLTHEAQNALLKTLEEAPGNALFFFVVPEPQALLATVRSRAQILHVTNVGLTMSYIDAATFLKAAPAKRLDMLKPLLEKNDDDKRDLGAIISFLSALERELEEQPASLPPVYAARKYITDRGALVKPLLEQVALLV